MIPTLLFQHPKPMDLSNDEALLAIRCSRFNYKYKPDEWLFISSWGLIINLGFYLILIWRERACMCLRFRLGALDDMWVNSNTCPCDMWDLDTSQSLLSAHMTHRLKIWLFVFGKGRWVEGEISVLDIIHDKVITRSFFVYFIFSLDSLVKVSPFFAASITQRQHFVTRWAPISSSTHRGRNTNTGDFKHTFHHLY